MHSLAMKIVSLAVLFLVTLTAGIIPIKLQRKRTQSNADRRSIRDNRRKQLISLCTCFAGGAFFASSMLELIPVVQKDFKAVFDNANINTNFPVAEFGISIGFFLILTLEQIIHVVKERSQHTEHEDTTTTSTKDPLLGNSHTSAYGTRSRQPPPSDYERDSGESDNDEPEYQSSSLVHQNNHQYADHSDYQYIQSEHEEHELDIFASISQKHRYQRHYLRSYLLLVALSIHALFEGLALGLFQNIDSMIQVLGALIIHKCILAFSMGINLVQHSFPALMVAKSAFLFSAMSPIGFGIGILMLTYTSLNVGHILSAIFQAIATGTFLYVTFFEILFHELNSKECHKMLKVLMIIFGYSVIAVLQYFEMQ